MHEEQSAWKPTRVTGRRVPHEAERSRNEQRTRDRETLPRARGWEQRQPDDAGAGQAYQLGETEVRGQQEPVHGTVEHARQSPDHARRLDQVSGDDQDGAHRGGGGPQAPDGIAGRRKATSEEKQEQRCAGCLEKGDKGRCPQDNDNAIQRQLLVSGQQLGHFELEFAGDHVGIRTDGAPADPIGARWQLRCRYDEFLQRRGRD